MYWKDENKEKEAGNGPFLSNQNFLYVGESDKLFLLIDLTS